jgi:hypothetical protein
MLKVDENNMMNKLVFKDIKFYCQKDRLAFFEWIKRLEYVHDVIETDQEVIIDLFNGDLNQLELFDLIALFHRYKVDLRQLQKLVRPSNRRWLMKRRVQRYKEIFGEEGPIIKNGLVFGPLNFCSPEDKEMFLDWVQTVRHLESYRFKKNVLYANLYSTPIGIEDLKNLIGIFKRYNLDKPEQLKERFGSKKNQHLFNELIKKCRGKCEPAA